MGKLNVGGTMVDSALVRTKMRRSSTPKPARPPKIPTLPQLLNRKIYKTGQTRGADDDEIFQNRVSRTSTALMPFSVWVSYFEGKPKGEFFERGYIVLISPASYFEAWPQDAITAEHHGLELGKNALVFYENRQHWINYPPEKQGWTEATSRQAPLGGQYIARISATTALDEGGKINRGFTSTSSKGAGIRVYEYANQKTIDLCRIQLETLYWLSQEAITIAVANGMTVDEAKARMEYNMERSQDNDLLDFEKLFKMRIINADRRTTCPLCLEPLHASGFFSLMDQAEGREVADLTVTQVSLFHIAELRMGIFNHLPYNLGWGHHHCNVVAKDSGIDPTIVWMHEVVQRNIDAGYFQEPNKLI